MFYATGWAIRLGQAYQLYDLDFTRRLQDFYVGGAGITLPYDHPPFEALLFEPFSYLNYRQAYLLFLGVNIGLLTLTFFMMHRWMRNLERIYWWLPGALFLAYLPIADILLQGQDSLILLALLTGAAIGLERQLDGLAGILVGLGSFRFHLTLPIALLFLLWRRWRFVAGFAAAFAALVGISVALMGASVLNYIRLLLDMSVRFDSRLTLGGYAPSLHLEMMPNVRGLVTGLTHLTGPWVAILTSVISASIFVLGWRAKPERKDALLVAIAVCIPIGYHLLMHDLSLLLLPIAVSLDRISYSETSAAWQDRLPTRLAGLAFVAPLLISYAPSHFWIAAVPFLAFAVVCCLSRISREAVQSPSLESGLSLGQSANRSRSVGF